MFKIPFSLEKYKVLRIYYQEQEDKYKYRKGKGYLEVAISINII